MSGKAALEALGDAVVEELEEVFFSFLEEWVGEWVGGWVGR